MEMSESQYESSEEGNESAEEHHPQKRYYDELQGEYDEEEYEHIEDNDEYEEHNRPSKTRSSRSSHPHSHVSSEFIYNYSRKSLFRKGTPIDAAEGEMQHEDNQDIFDSLPEDIGTALLDHWQKMEEFYFPVIENSFRGIHQAHKRVMSYPTIFQEEFIKQLEGPDDRIKSTERFKTDFNRVPLYTRTEARVQSILFQRINEFLVKIEGLTEEKYANAKRNAYNILSKGFITTESEIMAGLFGTLLQAETDRYADTMNFINEHYYNIIAIELGMPNKVRWKEVLEIGLIKKKCLCEHFHEQCLLREELGEDDSGRETGASSSSSNSDFCGAGKTGQYFRSVCENDGGEITDESLYYKDHGGEGEGNDFWNDAKMNGEMKISLEFDNDEFMGEGDWEAYAALKAERMATAGSEVEKMEGKKKIKGSVSSSKKSMDDVVSKKSKRSEKSIGGNQKKSNENVSKEPSQFDYGEGYEEELDMEQEMELETPEYFEEEEYPGEFWEGEGDGARAFKKKSKKSSVTFDPKETYIRDFYWDSDPSKQDASKSEQQDMEKEECMDEGYIDDEEIYDDEDIFYNREEFFEKEEANPKKGSGKYVKTIATEPEELHFAIFGQERDTGNGGVSLLNKLLRKWFSPDHTSSPSPPNTSSSNPRSLPSPPNSSVSLPMPPPVSPTHVDDAGGRSRIYSKESSGRMFSPSTPASTIMKPNIPGKVDVDSVIMMNGNINSWFQSSAPSYFPTGPGLLKLSPELVETMQTGKVQGFSGRTQQKQPLLYCFINLNHEIWNGFETAFVEAKISIKKLMTSLKGVVAKAYPPEPKADPCEEENDEENEDEDNLDAEGENESLSPEQDEENEDDDGNAGSNKSSPPRFQALKCLRATCTPPSDSTDSSVSELMNLQPSFSTESDSSESSIVELETLQSSCSTKSNSAESSVADLITLQTKKMSQEGEHSPENLDLQPPQTEEKSVDSDKMTRRTSVSKVDDEKKKSIFIHEDSASQQNSETKHSGEDSVLGTAEDENEGEKRSSETDLATVEQIPSLLVISPQSDIRTASTELKSLQTNLERITGDIDIRIPESPTEPSPEDKKARKQEKRALLAKKLRNWEHALELESNSLFNYPITLKC